MIFSKLRTLTKTKHLITVTTIVRTYSYDFKPLFMPKDLKQHMQELQKQRMRIKTRSIKYTPTFAYLQVIGHGTRAESRSVFLCTDHWNYLFNCGEGTQRLAAEHHAKLAKTENIFLTRPTWNNMGGLPGIVLTIQETGVPVVHLHGPEDSIGMIEATKNFMILTDLTVKPVDTNKSYKDQTMTVDYVLIQKPRPENDEEESDFEVDQINFYAYQSENKKRPRSPISEKKVLKKKSKTDDLMIFVCTLEKKAGTLNVQKCLELGVPPGPLMGKLKAGEDVTLPNGTVVESKDVVGESDKGTTFIVAECPSEEWIDLIVENSAFAKYQNKTGGDEVSCIVHFTSTEILNNPKYKDWMHKFGSNTTHMIVNEDNTGYSSEAMYKMQHQLHLIHPTIFPIFQNQQKSVEQKCLPKININLDEETPETELDSKKDEKVKKDDFNAAFLEEGLKVRQCKTQDWFHLRPANGLDTEKNLNINPNTYVQEAMEVDGFLDSLADLQTEIGAKTRSLGDDLEEYPKILMLGTGSSVPNKVRNTSGILFQIDEERSMLFDCGEATVNQIVRFYGKSKADEILRSIKAVYISHLHADHHLGLIGLLEQKRRLKDDKIFLLSPTQILPYLRYYDSRFSPIQENFQFISNRDLILNKQVLSTPKREALYEALNIDSISTEFALHCPFSYCIAVTLKDKRKICYSGDTMPCDNMTRLASDSFLLIHEATMEDALESEAVVKRHSTISQAIKVGVKANVNFTLLTHFSQRYCKLPLLLDSEQSGNDYSNVGIAYDFMSISLSRLSLLPLFYKTLGVMFNEFREELFQRAVKRDYQRQLLK